MAHPLKITRVSVFQYKQQVTELGVDYNGFNSVYEPGARRESRGHVLKIDTDAGISGEYAGGDGASYAQLAMFAHYLLGKDPLQRELIFNDVKRALRKHDRMAMGPVDIVLWDIAGKLHQAPVFQLLGGWKTSLPAYASTYHGDENGGLSSPEAFADFAVQCQAMGYPAYKIHGWGRGPIQREMDTVLETRKRVGAGMDLMIDPACEYDTFADALKVGRTCDEASYFWYEDPYKDGGVSGYAHRKLRQLIKTPILIGEHTRGFEAHVDLMVQESTDFVRADPDYDGGITGVMKIAHAAEGFGLDVEIHAPGPPHRHCMASIRNTNYYELGLLNPKVPSVRRPVYLGDYSDAFDAVDSRGHVSVPTGPGLGVAIDWDFVRHNQTGVTVYE